MKRLVACLLAFALILACLPAFAEDGTIRYADRGDQVVKLQERLIQLGFLTGEADGQYGKKTETAILRFHKILIRRAGGNPANASGRSISAEDLEVLYADPFSFYAGDLKNGDEGSEVEQLQSALVRLNYLDGKADGYFAEYTEEAVKYFQELNNLPVTGIADKATQDLAATLTVPADHPAYRDLKKGDKGKAVRAVQKRLVELGLMEGPGDGVFGKATVAAMGRFQEYLKLLGDPFTIEDTSVIPVALQKKLEEDIPVFRAELASGSKDEDEVLRLQRRLNALGYIGRKTIDGQYGKGVKESVALFQTNNTLPSTGVADEATQRLLFSENPVGMLTEYRLNVSLEDQRVYVYKLGDDKQYSLVNTFVCSTGFYGPTPTGVFTTTGPARRWHFFKEFDIWAQYAYSIEGDILFHSVLFKKRGGKPTSASVWALGQKASHGCVRLSVENAKWVYENCKRGTVVTIY
jgi:peptidoglycan hydrolase-like protein with peptidoglycan-binding domain